MSWKLTRSLSLWAMDWKNSIEIASQLKAKLNKKNVAVESDHFLVGFISYLIGITAGLTIKTRSFLIITAVCVCVCVRNDNV